MAGRYQVYPEYKDSNVETLGNIPSPWNARQVRFLLKDGAEGIKIGPFGSALKLEDMVDSGYRVYGQENVIKNDFFIGKRKISLNKFKEMQVYQIHPKDILLTMMGTSGKCQIVPENIVLGIIDSHLLRLRVKKNKILPQYFRLLIDECHEIKCQIQVFGKGSIMHGLNSSIVKALNLPKPSLAEQNQIVSFIDHETTKIDTLIEKQQQLIKLLKEKRQAVISHAVTKGLNPDVPMKDSGVEWLEEVPSHWDVARSKNLFKERTGRSETGGEELLTVSHITGVTKRSEKDVNMTMAESLSGYKLCAKSDLIINTMWAWMGAMGCSFQNGIVSPSYNIYQILDKQRLSVRFIDFLVRTPEFISIATSYSKGIWSSRLRLYPEPFLNIKFAIPPIEEQIEIENHIESQTGLFNKVINKCKNSISLMIERRTALISAAVTGKIDVRNWQSPEQTRINKEGAP